jgi:hypothetical protein
MWRQVIITRLKDGKEGDLPRLFEAPRASEQPGSGLVRSIGARDQEDRRRVYNFVFFESEEKARAREEDPRRQEALVDVRALKGQMFDGPPEFVDLEVVNDDTP